MNRLPALPPALVAGRPILWASDLTIGGLLLPAAALAPPTLGTFAAWPLFSSVEILPLMLATSVVGGLLGVLAPHVLEKLRKQVPLSLIALLVATLSTAVMLFVAIAAGAPSVVALLWGALGAWFGGVFWLPYLVARVYQRSTWPIVVTGLASASALSSAFVWLVSVAVL